MVTAPPAPTRRAVSRGRWVLRLAGALFWLLLGLWTWKLLEPYPVPEVVNEALSFSAVAKLIAAKCLHVGGYAVLAGLAWVATPPGRWRWAAVVFLLLHGAGTELAQHLMDVGRTGKVIDVTIDWVGTAAGVVAARRVWRS